MLRWLWPGIEDIEDAKKLNRNGAGIAFFIAAVTAIVAYLQASGRINLFAGLGREAYVDAGLFVAIGLGLLTGSNGR